jgi:anhydro-N-acetylmuramic acid kinase
LPEKEHTHRLILGLMSGTSLDGLDMALCEFTEGNFNIITAKTTQYTSHWKRALSEAKNAKGEQYFSLHVMYGKFIAEEIKTFLKLTDLKPEAIASHGHTIFHQPELGFSSQLGCGATIAANTGITTVCDFRSLDVALGGQGAPLVPVGDKLLFGKYQACLNIGGIANVSFDKDGKRIAYDISVANMLLNYLSDRMGEAYDKGGEIARSGKINQELLKQFNSLSYYTQKGAKSLGREWFEKNMKGLMDSDNISTKDYLHTATEHVAQVISNDLNQQKFSNVFVTGGGAFNTFLMEKIKEKTTCEIILPPANIINFKEALIFAFLGHLRLNREVNTLSSVTGAKRDSIGGAVYFA